MTAQWIASTTWAYEPSEVREAIARYIIRVWDGSLSRHIMSIAYICEGFRTPIGRYGGALAQVRTDDLASVPLAALRDKFQRSDWEPLDEVVLGCTNQAGEDNRNVAGM